MIKDKRVTIVDKHATYNKDDGTIVCGNSDYRLIFDFDEEWSEHRLKTARFIWDGKYKDVVFDGNICPVPTISNAVRVLVGVFAGDLITSTSAIVPCERGILCDDGVPAPPDDDTYSKLVAMTTSALEAAESARQEADDMSHLVGDIDEVLDVILDKQAVVLGGDA